MPVGHSFWHTSSCGANSDARPFRKLPARRYRYPVMRRQSAGLLRADRDTEESFGSPPMNGSMRPFSFCQSNEDIPVRPQPKRAASTRPKNNCAGAKGCVVLVDLALPGAFFSLTSLHTRNVEGNRRL